MDIRGTRILVIGGAGLIGSHVVEALLMEDVREVIIYDNFCRGTYDNLSQALRDVAFTKSVVMSFKPISSILR
jgi:UDP-glucose 4-epimerase